MCVCVCVFCVLLPGVSDVVLSGVCVCVTFFFSVVRCVCRSFSVVRCVCDVLFLLSGVSDVLYFLLSGVGDDVDASE
jgi:hypothetical protein